jgi:3-phosphoshikimate 1-carboxyvinyltransferase
MALPELIEIVPLDKPVRAEITVPGSKSITNRALILAAFGDGETTLRGALWSEDTQVMVECLQELGFMVNVEEDPDEACNRTITVYGKGGAVPRGGTEPQPLELFVGNAGTAARFLAAFVCLGQGVYRLHGTPRMHERPQASLFRALRELGYRIDSPNDRLPATIYGAGPREGKCRVSISESSQFASALLLAGQKRWEIEVTGSNADEQPYVGMTRTLVEEFGGGGRIFQIEPDASSGSYFWGAGWLLASTELKKAFGNGFDRVSERPKETIDSAAAPRGVSSVSVARWPTSALQIDSDLVTLIFGRTPQIHGEAMDGSSPQDRVCLDLPNELSRAHDLGDGIMTAAVLAPFAGHMIRLTDLRRLRNQETERVVALRNELTRCGAQVAEQGDTLTILPSAHLLHSAEIETYNDHRMAMCFAIPGLKVPGIKIKNPSCVKKTFPNFFQKLATPPPAGLGVRILDGKSGRALSGDELFAE